jgi:acetyl esterase/lipase
MIAVAEVTRLDDLVYSTVGGLPRLADVYQPEGEGPFPAVLFLHGGGWRFGDRRLAPDLSRFFAQDGFVMVSIDYRLSSEAVFPAAVIDVACAVRWMKAQADVLRIDPDRIAILGSSAGAHLGLLAGFAPEAFTSDEWAGQDPHVAAIVDGYGPSDFLRADAMRDPSALPGTDPESARLPAPGPSADPNSLESLFLGAPIGTVPERVLAANPAQYATQVRCPVLILHGDCDAHVPLDQSRLVWQALCAASVTAIFIEIQGLGHGFLNRTNLDLQGPHRATRYDSRSPDTATPVEIEIWPEIRRFLRQTLA